MNGRTLVRFPAAFAVALAAAALAAPTVSAYPTDPEGNRLVASMTSRVGTGSKPNAAKPAKPRTAPRPKPPLEP